MITETTPQTPTPSPIARTLPDGHQLISPVVIRPTYAIGYESWNGRVFMHLRLLAGLSGNDADALSRDVTACVDLLGRPLFALGIPNHAGFGRILQGLKFAPVAQVVNHAGDQMDLFVRAPNDGAAIQDGAH